MTARALVISLHMIHEILANVDFGMIRMFEMALCDNRLATRASSGATIYVSKAVSQCTYPMPQCWQCLNWAYFLLVTN